MNSNLGFTSGRSIEAEKAIRVRHQVADYAQAGEDGQIADRDIPPLGPISAGEQIQPASPQSLELRISQPCDRIIDAIEINLDSLV